jgi:transposase
MKMKKTMLIVLVAISMNGLVGAKIYEKGGMTKERFVDFIDLFIKDKYKNHLIILDNAGSHQNNIVKNKIIQTDNKYLFSIPYQHYTNAIENFFSQLKHYLKLNKPSSSFTCSATIKCPTCGGLNVPP